MYYFSYWTVTNFELWILWNEIDLRHRIQFEKKKKSISGKTFSEQIIIESSNVSIDFMIPINAAWNWKWQRETKTCSVWGFVSNGYINGYGKTDTCNSLNIWLSVWASFSQQTFKIVRRPSPFTRSSTRNLHLLTVATICQPCRACMRLLYDKRDIEMWIECKYKTSVAHSTE